MMTSLRAFALASVGLVFASCGQASRDVSPIGTWVIIEDSTRSAEFVTVTESQTIRDIEAAGSGEIVLHPPGDHLLDDSSGTNSTIRLRYIQALYGARSDLRSQISLTAAPAFTTPGVGWGNGFIDITDPDSSMVVHGEDWHNYFSSQRSPPSFTVTPDSATFHQASFTLRASPTPVGSEAILPEFPALREIVAEGTLVFARRAVAADREVRFGRGRVIKQPLIYSMRFEPDGIVQMYGEGWRFQRSGLAEGRWVRLGPREIQVDFGHGNVSVYRLAFSHQTRTLTVMEDTPCVQACRSFFSAVLDVAPGTLRRIRTEQTRTYESHASGSTEALPQPPEAPVY